MPEGRGLCRRIAREQAGALNVARVPVMTLIVT
jgi:hypothetical protein